MMHPIYLDGSATLRLAPDAREAMLAVWTQPGNAGSPNISGEMAARTIANGREFVADLIGASSHEITFTPGATEANNLTIIGAVRTVRNPTTLATFKINLLPRLSRSCIGMASASGRCAAKIRCMPAARAFTPKRETLDVTADF